MKYAITGATGNLGSRVVEELTALVPMEDIITLVHTPAKAKSLLEQDLSVRALDYYDVDSMVKAFVGVDLLIYIPSKTYDVLQRVVELENTIKAMKKAKLNKMIFVSFFADQENNPFVMSPYYGYAPRRLAGAGIEYAIAKNSLYANPLVPYLPELIERENIIYPVGEEKLSFISLENSAEAIAKLAIQDSLINNGQTYLLSQSQNYSMEELAGIMTEVTGEKIGYQPVSLTEFAEIYKGDGDGEELASMYRGGAMGLLAEATNDFEKITGHSPTDMKAFLQENYTTEVKEK